MKQIWCLLAGLGLVLMAAVPATAYTAKSLAITVTPDGGADVDMQYELSPLEQTAVFLRIADPAGELKKAFDSKNSQPVTVSKATGSSALVHVPAYADVSSAAGTVTMVTPSLSFEKAQEVMDGYWFAALVSPDFSPVVTTVTFPDGYRNNYYDALTIPSVTHTLKG